MPLEIIIAEEYVLDMDKELSNQGRLIRIV
jgi:hypothetical protein